MTKKILHLLIVIVLVLVENISPIFYVGAEDFEESKNNTLDTSTIEETIEEIEHIEDTIEEEDDKEEDNNNTEEDITNGDNSDDTDDKNKQTEETTNEEITNSDSTGDNGDNQNSEDSENNKDNEDNENHDEIDINDNEEISEDNSSNSDVWLNEKESDNSNEKETTDSENNEIGDNQTETEKDQKEPQDSEEIVENNNQQNTETQTNTAENFQNIWWWSSHSAIIEWKYLITFKNEYGETIESVKYEKWEDIIPLAYLEKDWYTLDWRYNEDYSIKYDFPMHAESDLTLYAKWNINNEHYAPEYENLNQTEISGFKIFNNVRIDVLAPIESFPEWTELVITPIETIEQHEEIITLFNEQISWFEDNYIISFDISFIYEWKEIQPVNNQTVDVTFNYIRNNTLKEANDDKELELVIYHIDDKKSDWESVIEEIDIVNNESWEITISAEKFSPYSITIREINPTPEWTDQILDFSDYKEIEVTRPEWYTWYGPEKIIMMDRNLWANSTYDDWYYYQWWNNHWFKPGSFETTTIKAIWNDSYNNKWYYWEKFIKTDVDYWENGLHHNNLRWWEGDNENNHRGACTDKSLDRENRQGPCPEWWHVPSIWELNTLLEYEIANFNRKTELVYSITNGLIAFDSDNSKNINANDANAVFVKKFLDNYSIVRNGIIETNWNRKSNTATHLLSSSANNSNIWSYEMFLVYSLDTEQNKYYRQRNKINNYSKDNSRTYWFNVRCFRNTETYEDSAHTHNITFINYKGEKQSKQYNECAPIQYPEEYNREWYKFIWWMDKKTENLFSDTHIKQDTTLIEVRKAENVLLIEKLTDTINFSNDDSNETLTSKSTRQSSEKIDRIQITDTTDTEWYATINLNLDENFKWNIFSSSLNKNLTENEYNPNKDTPEKEYKDKLSLALDIPPFTPSGSYNGTITFTYYPRNNEKTPENN